MAGVTKHIFEYDIRDILEMLNSQLRCIQRVLPRNYTDTDVINTLKRFYLHEWTSVEMKYWYYQTKDKHIKRRLGKTRYNADDNEDCKIIYIAQMASEQYHCKVDIITEDTDYSAYLKGNEGVTAIHLREYMVTKQALISATTNSMFSKAILWDYETYVEVIRLRISKAIIHDTLFEAMRLMESVG